MVAIIVIGVIVWLSIPLVLSKAMARRGFDGLSYLVIGLLFVRGGSGACCDLRARHRPRIRSTRTA